MGKQPHPSTIFRWAQKVYIVEGEKDVDRLHELGLIATCNAGGAGKWKAEFSQHLEGRQVVVLSDNDDPGRIHAQNVAGSVHGKAASIKVVELPGLPEKGDVCDWLVAGGTVDRLAELIRVAPEWKAGEFRDISLTQSGGFPLTDSGNAERFAANYGDKVRFCHPWNRWLAWDGIRWAIDSVGVVEQFTKQTARSILQEPSAESDDEQRKALVKHATRSESGTMRTNMLRLAQSEPGIPIMPKELDQDVWTLNCRNGTINLRTGRLRPHCREDYITKLCNVAYDPDAACPQWLAFQTQICDGNESLIEFKKRLYGYCLTGDVSEQVLLILYGSGANGKSTEVNTFLRLLGEDYSMKAPADFLMAKRSEHPTAKAGMFGKRFVACVETDEGRRFAESMVKDLTGGEKIRARRMREDFWEFDPTHKIVLASNHKPTVRGTDHAIWRRPRLVPFLVTIPEAEQDKRLPEKLVTELPGILAWCVRGCLAWQEQGLGAPLDVLSATAEYQEEQDLVGEFIQESCVIGPIHKVRSKDLFGAYREFCSHSGEANTLSQRRFGESLTKPGLERYTNNGTWYKGIGLSEA